MHIPKKAVAGAAVLAALGLGAIPALAQDADDATEAPTEQPESTDPAERHAEQRTAFAEALAAELGLDVDTVTTAIETVHAAQLEERRAAHQEVLADRLAAAVEDGTLTQEQADALLAAQEAGVLGGPGLGGRGGPGFGGPGFGGRGHGRGPGGFAEPGDAAGDETGTAA